MKRILPMLLAISSISSITTAPTPQPKSQANSDVFDKNLYDWSRVFAEVCHVVKEKYYVKDLNPQDAMISALNSFVHLDPHSIFMDSKTYKQLLQSVSGEFYGVGIAMAPKVPDDEFLVVIDTVPGGPAESKGIKAGDKIIDVDGHALRGMTTDEITAKLKGPKGTPVTVKIIRDHYPEPLVITITRDIVKEQNSFCYLFKEPNVCYLNLTTFAQNSVNQLGSLLKKSQKQQYKAIILDLRNNGGGLLNSAIDIAELFLDKNSLVATTKDRNNKVTEEYRTHKEPIASTATPIFILVNAHTASSAEILAGALKVHSEKLTQQSGNKKQNKLLVFIVGTRSFGKGSVQELIPIGNDCALKLTTALYYLPNDITVQGMGIEPDVKIEQKLPPTEQMVWVNNFYGKESALKNSIKTNTKEDDKHKDKKKHHNKKLDSKKSMQDKRKEILAQDSQIRDTITCINILNTHQDKWKNRTDAIKLINSIFITDGELTLEEIEA